MVRVELGVLIIVVLMVDEIEPITTRAVSVPVRIKISSIKQRHISFSYS